MRHAKAKVTTRGRSQTVRLPKGLRFKTGTVLGRREGNAVILEPDDGWPEGFFESLGPIADDFVVPSQEK